jgi:glutamate decarboxylase
MSHPSAHSIAPAYTGRLSTAPIPALRLPDESIEPDAAYRFIRDEMMLDGSSRLNLATFVTTWMDPEAEKLMAETFDKNMIDKDEYPATAAIEERCVCMVADLFNAEGLRESDPSSATGVSTIGSSEAVMLAGLAMKWRWRQKVGADWPSRTPNLVMGSNVQVVWEKFCRYFDVEPRYLPMEKGRYVITPDQVVGPSTTTPSGWPRFWAPPTPGSSNPSRGSVRRSMNWPPAAVSMCRCTSTRPAAVSWSRFYTRTWSGISGCPGWPRSTPAATSTG